MNEKWHDSDARRSQAQVARLARDVFANIRQVHVLHSATHEVGSAAWWMEFKLILTTDEVLLRLDELRTLLELEGEARP